MTKICENCRNSFKTCVKIGDKLKNIGNRKYCLVCSPFGLHNTAKICSKEELSERKENRRKKNTKYARDWQNKTRKERKERLVGMFGNKCECCGYDKCIAALEFHHIDKSTKRFSLGMHGLCRKWEEILEEVKKCKLLCANCHAELHYKEGRG